MASSLGRMGGVFDWKQALGTWLMCRVRQRAGGDGSCSSEALGSGSLRRGLAIPRACASALGAGTGENGPRVGEAAGTGCQGPLTALVPLTGGSALQRANPAWSLPRTPHGVQPLRRLGSELAEQRSRSKVAAW